MRHGWQIDPTGCPNYAINPDSLESYCLRFPEYRFWMDSSVDWPRPKQCPELGRRNACYNHAKHEYIHTHGNPFEYYHGETK